MIENINATQLGSELKELLPEDLSNYPSIKGLLALLRSINTIQDVFVTGVKTWEKGIGHFSQSCVFVNPIDEDVLEVSANTKETNSSYFK